MISATIDQDSIKNVCTGTGRIKLRITEDDDLDTIKLRYVNAGYSVIDHNENSKKKSNFTTEAMLSTKSPIRSHVDHKVSKQSNLQTGSPEAFGNSSRYKNTYNNHYDPQGIQESKLACGKEQVTVNNWNRVKSGGR